jgi:hypothetical protein
MKQTKWDNAQQLRFPYTPQLADSMTGSAKSKNKS